MNALPAQDMEETLPRQETWYLVLMIWGNKYPDDACNRIIDSALRRARACAGAVVLTDRLRRDIDPRARQVIIPPDFNTDRMKRGGLPVKMSMFDIRDLPPAATCIYLDLDTVVIGNLDRLAALTRRAPIWTIPVFPRPFSMMYRVLWRISRRRVFATGNSSAFVFTSGFDGNPAQEFRRLREAGALSEFHHHDDRFIAWCCQDKIRGLSINDVVSFRFEFLAPTMWLSDLFSILRAGGRRKIVAVTFAGPLTKPEALLALPDGAQIVDHHGRVGRWNDHQTNGLKRKIQDEMAA